MKQFSARAETAQETAKPRRSGDTDSPRLRIDSVRKGASGTATIAVGGSSFCLDLSLAESLGLSLARLEPGNELGEAESAILCLAAEAREAEKRGLALLARAEQSTFLLRCKLEQRGFSGRASSIALERLASSGWLDDRRFAKAYASSRLSRSGSKAEGPASLERELRERGIDRATAVATISELLGPDCEPEARALALAQAAKKALKRSAGDRDETRRMLRELGYKSEEISELFESLDEGNEA
jgi:regulatory protein